MNKYKVLTLWQPWASLYAHGIKKIETRPAQTSHRGTYLIHAAQKWSKKQIELCLKEPFKTELLKLGYLVEFTHETNGEKILFPIMPRGYIVGAVDVWHCARIYNYDDPETNGFPTYFEPADIGQRQRLVLGMERDFGDYSDGRFAWLGKNHRILASPIPYKNNQGYYQDYKGDESKLVFKCAHKNTCPAGGIITCRDCGKIICGW